MAKRNLLCVLTKISIYLSFHCSIYRYAIYVPRDYLAVTKQAYIEAGMRSGPGLREYFCYYMRHKAIFMYVNNMEEWGALQHK